MKTIIKTFKIFEMYENMDQDDIAEISKKKDKVKTVQLEIFKEQIETLQKRQHISYKVKVTLSVKNENII